MSTIGTERRALRIAVRGVVQGVGFRPFVHRLALREGLTGWVRNDNGAVELLIQGEPDPVDHFVRSLRAEAPALARLDSVECCAVEPSALAGFSVLPSNTAATGRLPVSPDMAICAACERELFDSANRRYRYPFITCTDCGPRFTVIDSMPYDRERTSMSVFQQCPACLREYRDPTDRRYHSETNSCARCGPQIWLASSSGKALRRGDRALADAAQRLVAGEIVALRGLGGFHLAASARQARAVSRLRARKHRDWKPLAVMVRTIAEANTLGVVGEAEAAVLASAERPIVLLQRRPSSGLTHEISPGLDTIGVMLAYTPLHLLLLDQVDQPLVMTSGNASDEPIATDNDEALRRLGDIADAFLLHDREIISRYDDSVVRIMDGAPLFLRRARGFAPLPMRLPLPTPVPLVCVGPHLKNTLTVAADETAFVSQHIGDLENLETLQHFAATLDRIKQLFRIEPQIAIRDLHPGYLSSTLAEREPVDRVIAVQHHHAHAAAVAAEYGLTEPVIALAFDGTGYGADGCVWGAELLVADLCTYRRLGHMRYAPLPGGDLAARQPWRVALGYASLEPGATLNLALALKGVTPNERATARAQIARRLNAPLASSMGRLFDAAAALLGVRSQSYYEGQAALELESLAGRLPGQALPVPIAEKDRVFVLDPLPLLAALSEAAAAGHNTAELAATFHESVAGAGAELALRGCEAAGLSTVVLGGGCFQNARLTHTVRARLESRGLRVLLPRLLSPNDGSISFGQAAIGAALLTAERGG